MPTQLDRAAVAEKTGLAAKTIDTYWKNRDQFPAPDGYVGRSPWWFESTVDRWLRQRAAAEAKAAAR